MTGSHFKLCGYIYICIENLLVNIVKQKYWVSFIISIYVVLTLILFLNWVATCLFALKVTCFVSGTLYMPKYWFLFLFSYSVDNSHFNFYT